jgi:hypothetical protein
MEIRLDSKDGPRVGTPEKVIADFAEQARERQSQWTAQVAAHPDTFSEVEYEIDQYFRQAAGVMTAAVLGQATAEDAMRPHEQQVRQQAATPLKSPEKRKLQVRLLCGLVLYITTLYCAPDKRRRGQGDGQEEILGLYPELAALGFGKGCSPALQYTVARIVAFSSSIEAARKELRRQGVVLDKKTVRRIAEQLGQQLLELRCRELMAWRAGDLPAGRDFTGRRVAVQIDGGRVRLRENKKRKGPAKKGRRGKFKTPWREPKVLIIFEFDQHGKMVTRERQPLIDGTLLGPDHLAELVAFHLHRLGVARAESVVFISDGAPWIWDRLAWIEQRAGLDPSRTVSALDFCHAAHHISLALKALGLEGKKHRSVYRAMRQLLRQSRYAKVVSDLTRRAKQKKLPSHHAVWTEIEYLRKHGVAGHLRYQTFRRRGLPCGSGAIESTIRRAINLRLKSNSMYWLEENAEGLFAIRALLLCDRWEETLVRLRQAMARDHRINWRWKAPQLKKLKPNVTMAPSSPKTPETSDKITLAA